MDKAGEAVAESLSEGSSIPVDGNWAGITGTSTSDTLHLSRPPHC